MGHYMAVDLSPRPHSVHVTHCPQHPFPIVVTIMESHRACFGDCGAGEPILRYLTGQGR